MIRERLAVLEPTELTIIDDSALHAGHAGAKGGGGHYYTGKDPDGLWINWGGLSHGDGRVTVPMGNSAATVKQVVRHEAGHATKFAFQRDVFGPSLDHSASIAGIMYYSTEGGTTFTDREKKILRGIKP